MAFKGVCDNSNEDYSKYLWGRVSYDSYIIIYLSIMNFWIGAEK